MDQLFQKLPRDLQWEILADFVGTHVVRNGKLIRKIVFTIRDGVTLRHLGRDLYLPVVNPTRIRESLPWLYKSRRGDPDYGDTRPFYVPCFPETKQIKFFADARTGETLYGFRKQIAYQFLWVIHSPTSDTSDDLPPFEKHSYPSYPYTAQKKKKIFRCEF